jgi:hypothetical protein
MHRARIVKRRGRRYCSKHHAAHLIDRTPPIVNDLVEQKLLRLHRVDGKKLIDIAELDALAKRIFCETCGQKRPEEWAS